MRLSLTRLQLVLVALTSSAAPVSVAQHAEGGQTPAADQVVSFGNPGLDASLRLRDGHLRIDGVKSDTTADGIRPIEPFVLRLQDGTEILASTMRVQHPLSVAAIAPEPEASRAAARRPGRQVCTDLMDPRLSASVHWCMIAREGTTYLRQEVTITSTGSAIPLADVQLFHFSNPAAHVVGDVPGSPLVAGNIFFGLEHPLSYSTTDHGLVVSGIKRTLPLAASQSITYSSVIGIARPGQMRRDFLEYIEAERAHPYRTFLHYNTWYDLGYTNRFDAAGVLDRMNAFGNELVQKRGVHMDSFLLDDGWDDTHTGWKLNSGFPEGFAPLRETAAKYGFGIGVWMSPWGGYQKEKLERIAYGQAHGLEIVDGGFALSGPRYYNEFESTCLGFIRQDGVNQFKFDGTGNAGSTFPGSVFDSDFAASIHLIERLRRQDPDIFINLTTGTKPSPFWLRFADSTWRAGEDNDFSGEGTWRQRWITYRDAQTYKNVVQRGPLYPLNSLMLHGLIYAKSAEHLNHDPGHDFAAEVHSYFGSGTQLQEMYITPSLLSKADWDTLAESAKWSRAHAAILRDTHWAGGDPGAGQVYGWASWSANSGILVLRNPAAKPQHIIIDLQTAWELPHGAQATYRLHSPWKSDAAAPSLTLTAHQSHTFELQPFEVLVLESEAPNTRASSTHD